MRFHFHKWEFIKHCGAYNKYRCTKCGKEEMRYIGDYAVRKLDNERIRILRNKN
ncbi:MAG: hypothetical protein K0R93_714 [Anaerosolibacter sp.]|jgi:hypothetical protein|nr:hypothetical protein [Anaerosolibacter sp.]